MYMMTHYRCNRLVTGGCEKCGADTQVRTIEPKWLRVTLMMVVMMLMMMKTMTTITIAATITIMSMIMTKYFFFLSMLVPRT